MKRIDLITGARPNFMKIAPIILALKAAQARGSLLRYRLVKTVSSGNGVIYVDRDEEIEIETSPSKP